MLTNAKDLLDFLRNNIGESSPSLWSNLDLLRTLNIAYQGLARQLNLSNGNWLVKKSSVSCVSSQITLPSDCAKPLYLESTNGQKINWQSSIAHRQISRTYLADSVRDSNLEAYLLGNVIVINSDSCDATYYLWYQQRIIDLFAGTASTSAVGSLTLEDGLRHSTVDDAYNNLSVEVVTGSYIGVYTITDYDAGTRELTLDTTTDPGTEDYGLVLSTPVECSDYVLLRATVLALSKPGANIDEKVYQMFFKDYLDAKRDVESWIASRIPSVNGITIGDIEL